MLWSEGGAVDRGRDRGGWVSLVSRGSLERLRAEAGVDEPVDGRRFRMLFEIDGVERARGGRRGSGTASRSVTR